MSNPTPPVIAPMLCHSHGESCTSAAAGHAVSAIRERVTAATPSKWRDGIVVGAPESDGAGGSWIGIDLLDTVDTTWVWNHGDLGAVPIGEPVALHELYDTLAIGATRLSVLRAPR
ncbi:hypothetical protein BH10ACT4_BH10ACT4_06260 [soil metagenome]